MKATKTIILFTLCLAIVACGDSASFEKAAGKFVHQNNIFAKTSRLTASAQLTEVGQPSFSWNATSKKHVICAIFKERIQVKNNLITNQDKVIWIWHTGFGTGREGNILFSQGGTSTTKANSPSPLQPGVYYWAVWALNAQGEPELSSVENLLNIPQPKKP